MDITTSTNSITHDDARPRLRVVSGLLATPDGRVLMGLRRSDKLRPSLWELPGGKVEPGETSEAALMREWREELGAEIRVIEGVLAETHLELEASLDLVLYRVAMVSSKIRALDHQELRWVTPDHAVRFMPCSPGFYVMYPAILAASGAVIAARVAATPGYELLAAILDEALQQAQAGKGRARHGFSGASFEEQTIVVLNEKLGSIHGQVYQAAKKSIEATQLQPRRARRDLLGAINYLAAAIIQVDRAERAGRTKRRPPTRARRRRTSRRRRS